MTGRSRGLTELPSGETQGDFIGAERLGRCRPDSTKRQGRCGGGCDLRVKHKWLCSGTDTVGCGFESHHSHWKGCCSRFTVAGGLLRKQDTFSSDGPADCPGGICIRGVHGDTQAGALEERTHGDRGSIARPNAGPTSYRVRFPADALAPNRAQSRWHCRRHVRNTCVSCVYGGVA